MVLSEPMAIGNIRRDSLMQALTYFVCSRMSGVTGDDLSGKKDITSSRSVSCFSGLFAMLYSKAPAVLPVCDDIDSPRDGEKNDFVRY